MYLLDANALISSHNTWYAIHRVPEFWEWLLDRGDQGLVKLPREIYAEVEAGNDDLAKWVKMPAMRASLKLEEETDPARVQAVLASYGDNLSEEDLLTIGQDPFLVASALGHDDRRVVTAEISKPGRLGPRRHVPNICEDCGVHWMSPVDFIHEMDFTTGWDAR